MGGLSFTKNETSSAGLAKDLSENIPDASDGLQVDWTLDISQAKHLMILADQDLTIYTNADAPGQTDTLNLKANYPIFWTPTLGNANPLTADVTALFVDNTSGSATILKIDCLEDPTG